MTALDDYRARLPRGTRLPRLRPRRSVVGPGGRRVAGDARHPGQGAVRLARRLRGPGGAGPRRRRRCDGLPGRAGRHPAQHLDGRHPCDVRPDRRRAALSGRVPHPADLGRACSRGAARRHAGLARDRPRSGHAGSGARSADLVDRGRRRHPRRFAHGLPDRPRRHPAGDRRPPAHRRRDPGLRCRRRRLRGGGRRRLRGPEMVPGRLGHRIPGAQRSCHRSSHPRDQRLQRHRRRRGLG